MRCRRSEPGMSTVDRQSGTLWSIPPGRVGPDSGHRLQSKSESEGEDDPGMSHSIPLLPSMEHSTMELEG